MTRLIIIAFLLVVPSISFAINLTPEEQNYLKSHQEITFCVDPDWYPFERVSSKGEHEGIAADLLRLVAERTGLRLTLHRTKDWDASLEASRSGKCQIMSFLNQTDSRDEWLLFTSPVFIDKNVFITREEHSFIADPAELANETIVFPSGTAMEELVRTDYPNLRIVTVDSENEAFQFVSDKKAHMAMRSLIMAAYTIKSEGLFNLKISGMLPGYTNKLRIGVIRSEPVLRDILEKGVATISNTDRERIVNKHITITAETAVDYTLIIAISTGFLLISIVGGYWSYRLKRMNAQLKQVSETDRLTGLFNRTKLDEVLQSEYDRARRYRRPLSVILADLDYFKRVNDEKGHLVGDSVLKEFALVARRSFRQLDVVGRWGGEEFLVICPETGAEEAGLIAERLRCAVEKFPFSSGRPQTVSLGVAVLLGDSDTLDALLKRTDDALYQAKRQGRNRVVFAGEEPQIPTGEDSLFMLRWSKEFCCGNEIIDRQHQELFTRANELLSLYAVDPSSGRTAASLERLLYSIEQHFADEETILQHIGYTGLLDHKRQHEMLLSLVKGLHRQAMTGSLSLGVLFEFIVNDVVLNHMLDQDRRFFSELRQFAGN